MALKKYVKYFFKVVYLYSVQPPFCCGGRGVESPTKISKKRTWKVSIFRERLLKKVGDFFQPGG